MAKFTNLTQLPMRNSAFQGIETLGFLPPVGFKKPPGVFSSPAAGAPRRVRSGLAAIAFGAAAAACSATSPFSSVPVAIVLPGNQVLKGGASTRIGRGTFQARDARVACSGSFNPGVVSSDVRVFFTCSDTQRGSGVLKADDSDSGRASVRLDGGQGEALFLYGDAARRL